ncbi:tetraacyldisaccharide 4'-kinase, partial [bacterium]|nr:tetraacyldisaccharide 4'-kinase [bacterium]
PVSREAPPARPRVVSVGALTAGGSGKTPVVLSLAEGLLARGYRTAIVSRGYGSGAAGPLIVDAADPSCGDEARMLAGSLSGCTVVQARDMAAGLRMLRQRRPDTEIVVLEDGHQCAGAGRHLDVLILDRWRTVGRGLVPETGLRLPWGPYREDATGAARAAVWLLSLREGEASPAQPEGGPDMLGFVRRASLPGGVATPAEMPYGVVSGIAAPERFEADCAFLCGGEPAVIARYDDHAAFSGGDVDDLLAVGAGAGARCWLTTAKDRVKLSPLWPLRAPQLHVVALELVWRSPSILVETVLSRLEA